MLYHSVSLSIGKPEPVLNTDVDVVINYPKSFQGQKFFKDGDIKTVSKEVAASFVKQGIAQYPAKKTPTPEVEPKAKRQKK